MAKPPGPPKTKTAAPAQFDMNSRERKGGKGGPGGPGRGRDDKRPPARIVHLPPTLVDRGEGWVIKKIAKIDQASHVAMGAEYQLIFEGHDALVFEYLGGAPRSRQRGAPRDRTSSGDRPRSGRGNGRGRTAGRGGLGKPPARSFVQSD